MPILPKSLQTQVLQQCHDSPAAGHQGSDKTLALLHKKAYWVSMVSDVEIYCQHYQKCQQSKLALPPRAPLTTTTIGKPWQMVAVDFLSVPVSTSGLMPSHCQTRKYKGTCQSVCYHGYTSDFTFRPGTEL